MADSYWTKTLVQSLNGMTGQTEDGSYLSVAIESVQARAIEIGLGYNVNLYNNTFAIAGTQYWLVRTPETGLITAGMGGLHCIDTASRDTGALNLDLYEDATVTADGSDTNVVIANFNRGSTNTATFTVKNAPTVTADGTQIGHTLLGSFDSQGAGITWQLKADTDYLIKVENVGGVEVSYNIELLMFVLPE